MGYVVCLAVGLVLGFIGSIVVACLVVASESERELEEQEEKMKDYETFNIDGKD